VTVSLQASSGDEIRRLELTETGPFTGEFQAVVPTAGAQALAFASESAPGRDPNMVISAKDYPGWQGAVGDKEKLRTFGIDLNDSVNLGRMTLDSGGPGQALTRFVLQTSMNGKDWVTRSRQPVEAAPWDGRPRIASIPTYVGGTALITPPKDREVPADWREFMELTSVARIAPPPVRARGQSFREESHPWSTPATRTIPACSTSGPSSTSPPRRSGASSSAVCRRRTTRASSARSS
jgi:hypothetical protein